MSNTLHALDLAGALAGMREANPLVQCLTNIVVANFTANVLLSAGASPAMVDNAAEAKIFAAAANATLVNTGTPYPDTALGMVEAAKGAAGAGHPWVLDPIAPGLPFRGRIARDALAAGDPAIIRGNASEIITLSGTGTAGRGADSTDKPSAALPSARALATAHHCVVAVSGPVDLITDGQHVVAVANGHPWMTKVTGVGCSLGALMAAFATVVDPLSAATTATTLLCVAAERAAAATRAPGSFAVALVDELHLITPGELAAAEAVRDAQA